MKFTSLLHTIIYILFILHVHLYNIYLMLSLDVIHFVLLSQMVIHYFSIALGQAQAYVLYAILTTLKDISQELTACLDDSC